MRPFTGKELVIATHNKGKAREMAELLKPYIENFYTSKELDLPEPEENADTFVGNALLKARAAAKLSGKPALADDSGLSINALGGDPGVYSARWGGQQKNFALAMEKVHQRLGDAPNRSASFMCVLALAWPDGHAEIFEGKVDGNIAWPPRGDKGFGYDPIFVPEGYTETFAEMDAKKKQEMSHRALAFAKMVNECFAQ